MAGRADKAVGAARAAAAKTPGELARAVPELQLLVAYPQLTLATFGRWDEVLREPLPGADLRLGRALGWYARGMALSARGRATEARAALDSLRSAGAAVTTYPGAPVLEIARRALTAELARRGADQTTAIRELEAAVRVEDSLTYMEPPYWHLPVRHLLGAALLDGKRPRDAERLYREDLARFPENVWSLRGLERSLASQGRQREAEEVGQRYRRAAQSAKDLKLATSRF